jgi:sortase B
MFGKLKLFREEGTFEKSKYFWMFTPDLIYQYRIFSATVVNKTGLAYQSFYTDEAFDEWITYAFENSEIDNQGIEVTKDDRVMTLSTCTGDDSTRFVIMGKLVQIYASK